MKQPRIKRKERDVILQGLRAGVVPRLGLQHIQVGRAREVAEMVKDVERIGEGGSAIRFVIGAYGSGKTFFLNLVRLVALEKGLVVMSADLAPDRRLHATGGQARALYAELTRNTSTRTQPDGGALGNVLERFIGQAAKDAGDGKVAAEIRKRLAHLEELVGGYDFALVVARYWEAYDSGDEALKSAALRWLRGEYANRTEARAALGVRTIVDDGSVYDHLKLLSAFVRQAGYGGLLVCLDEMVNLYKLSSSQARRSNFEQILRILNDVLQGSASHLGFLFGGTPEFLFDNRRGLYSYEALESRLAQNTFAKDGLVDLSGPVLQLQNLTPEELYVLLGNVRRVYDAEEGEALALPDEALQSFMHHCSQRIGEAYFRTPRNTVKAFIDLLSVLAQNPGTDWRDFLEAVEVNVDAGPNADEISDGEEDDTLASFKL